MASMVRFLMLLVFAFAAMALSWWIGLDGPRWQGMPVMFVCAALAFAINWLAFVPASIMQTETFYDLVGSITYALVAITAVLLSGAESLPALLVAAMVLVWCARLGSMLFARVKRDGGDSRFDQIKIKPLRFFGAWTIQGMWVVLTMAATLVAITKGAALELDAFFFLGAGMWALGFAIEVIADNQKSSFRMDPENKGRFIQHGLWSWSQHPNYFGEILLWAGLAVVAIPLLSGSNWAAMISPIFVAFLLIRVSGIPLLDRAAKKRWGDDEAYQDYRRRTSKLVPLPPKAGNRPTAPSST